MTMLLLLLSVDFEYGEYVPNDHFWKFDLEKNV